MDQDSHFNLNHKILFWDNDGTISATKDPNDRGAGKIILPNVANFMRNADFNFIISGFKSPESEKQNFDPEKIIENFTKLMCELPINAAAFSPLIGGIGCYVMIKTLDHNITVKKAHEDPRYKEYIGKFKKPEIGMFMVIKDIALEEFGKKITSQNTVMIGDTWHDEEAAKKFGIPFMNANKVHNP